MPGILTEIKQDVAERGCGFQNPEPWKFPIWYFTEKGLYIGAEFSHAGAACKYPEWSVIPYKIVQKYRNKQVKLNLPSK